MVCLCTASSACPMKTEHEGKNRTFWSTSQYALLQNHAPRRLSRRGTKNHCANWVSSPAFQGHPNIATIVMASADDRLQERNATSESATESGRSEWWQVCDYIEQLQYVGICSVMMSQSILMTRHSTHKVSNTKASGRRLKLCQFGACVPVMLFMIIWWYYKPPGDGLNSELRTSELRTRTSEFRLRTSEVQKFGQIFQNSEPIFPNFVRTLSKSPASTFSELFDQTWQYYLSSFFYISATSPCMESVSGPGVGRYQCASSVLKLKCF